MFNRAKHSEPLVSDTPVTPGPVSGIKLHTPPGGVRKLNRRGAGIAFGLTCMVVAIAGYALVTQERKPGDQEAKSYEPTSSRQYASSLVKNQPEGTIGAESDVANNRNSDSHASPSQQPDPPPDDDVSAHKADETTDSNYRTARNVATDSMNLDLSARIAEHHATLRKLHDNDEIRRIKQQQEQMHAAVQSSIVVNFNRAGDPKLEASGQSGGTGANSALAGNFGGGALDKLNDMRMAALNARTKESTGVNLRGALAGLGLGGSRADYSDINRHAQKSAFVDRQQAEQTDANYLPHTRTEPIAEFEIKAGTILPATLISGVNSDLPGQLLAQVSHNVLDTATGEYVLIPQGAKLIGRYDSDVSYGQSRALIVWNRIIYPDGSSLSLQGMQGHDTEGYSGFSDQVNNHYVRIFGSAILMSFVSGAITISSDTDPYSEFRSNRDVLNESMGREIGRVATELVRRNLRIAPTIEVRPGYRFAVVANKDIVLAPYEPMQTLLRNRGRVVQLDK